MSSDDNDRKRPADYVNLNFGCNQPCQHKDTNPNNNKHSWSLKWSLCKWPAIRHADGACILNMHWNCSKTNSWTHERQNMTRNHWETITTWKPAKILLGFSDPPPQGIEKIKIETTKLSSWSRSSMHKTCGDFILASFDCPSSPWCNMNRNSTAHLHLLPTTQPRLCSSPKWSMHAPF